jgi:hypothetical protein
LRDNRVVKKIGTRHSRITGPDGITEWTDADGVVFKMKTPDGRITWYDAEERRHRDGGPAIENPDGSTAWF